jgi:hypothetical protein
MDGRRPTGILYVNTDVDDPTKQAEYDRWYHDVHFPDVTEPGIFVNALMLHNARVPPPGGEGRFLAFYETYWSDVAAATVRFAEHVDVWVKEGRIHPGTTSRSFGAYRRLAVEVATQRRPRSQSLVAVHVDGYAPELAHELAASWALGRAGAVLEAGHFHTASIHELVRSEAFREVTGDQARFLLLYESDFGDPLALEREVLSALPPGVLPAGATLRGAASFYRASA